MSVGLRRSLYALCAGIVFLLLPGSAVRGAEENGQKAAAARCEGTGRGAGIAGVLYGRKRRCDETNVARRDGRGLGYGCRSGRRRQGRRAKQTHQHRSL